MKIKWLRIYRKLENRVATENRAVKPVCNYQDNYYGDQACRLQ